MEDVLTLILGGGRGARLYPLTKHRSEPAVPIAGKYRLIDIPISNCINSDLKRIYVLTQFLSVSLHKHLAHTYKFDPFSKGFVEVLPAQQTNETAAWYSGTADAVRQHLSHVRQDPCHQVLILCSDQLYRIDFRDMVKTHRRSMADISLAVLPVTRDQASNYGIVKVDDTFRITALVEKPTRSEELDALRLPAGWLEQQGVASRGREYLANMGIYLANRPALLHLFETQPTATDLVTQLFAQNLRTHYIQAHVLDGYWADVGSIASYHEAHLALASNNPPFEFQDNTGLIYTRMRHLPASRLSDAQLSNCLVSDGCLVQEGAHLERCVIGLRSRIGKNVRICETVVNGADRYETQAERDSNQRRSIPDLGVGEGSIIERAILDKDCRIGRGVQIINKQKVRHAEGENYVIRDGIVVIPNGAIVPDGAVI